MIESVDYQGDYPTMSKVLKYNGNTLKEEVHSSEGQLEKLIKYNDAGNLSEVIFYDWDGEIKDRYETRDNKQGQKSLEKSYEGANKLISEISYVYDDQGKIVEENWIDYENKSEGKTLKAYTYDERGNWIQSFHFDKEGKKIIDSTERVINYFD